MKLLSWNELEARGPYAATPTALTIGVFDGVHIGHRAVIARVTDNGAGLLPVAVTFRGNPQNVLRENVRVKDILTNEQKLSIMESLGVVVVVMIDFSLDFSKMAATSFLARLSSAFCIKKIVEGDNFYFGSGREADRRALEAYCTSIGAVLETPERVTYRGAPVSSTRVRHAIRFGLVSDVSAMLAGEYAVVVPRAALSRRETGALTVAKALLPQAVPDAGVFRCAAETEAGARDVVVEIDRENMVIRAAARTVISISFKEKTT